MGECRRKANLKEYARHQPGYGRPDPKLHSTTGPNGHVIPRCCRAPRHQQQADHIATTHQSRYLRRRMSPNPGRSRST
jgi:hypothetical protein